MLEYDDSAGFVGLAVARTVDENHQIVTQLTRRLLQ